MIMCFSSLFFFFFIDTATTEIYTLLYTLSLHDALPISWRAGRPRPVREPERARGARRQRFRRGVAGGHAAPARHSGIRVEVHRRLPRHAHERARLPARRHGDRRIRDPGAHPDRLTVRSLPPARRRGVDLRTEARRPALLR